MSTTATTAPFRPRLRGPVYALTFAARYPDEVAGMVLVDSTAPGSTPPLTSRGNEGSYDIMGRASALLSASASLGLGRLLGHLTYGSLPPRARDEAIASAATPNHLQSTIDEYIKGTTSTDQAASLGDFADRPLVVLAAGSGSDAEWKAAQDDLASLSTNSAHRVVDGAVHGEMLVDEDAAAATTQAILDVISSVRSEVPLVR